MVDTGEIMVFVGKDFVVTVRHGRHGSLGPLREELETDPQQLARGRPRCCTRSRTMSSTRYLSVTDAVQADIDQVETEVCLRRTARGSTRPYLPDEA